MSRILRRLAATIGATLLATAPLMSVIGTAPANAKPSQEPVAICHYDTIGEEWELLLVKPKAATAHLKHGDAYPGEAVPGTDGTYLFDENCVPQPVTGSVAVKKLVTGDTQSDVTAFGFSVTDQTAFSLSSGETSPTFTYPMGAAVTVSEQPLSTDWSTQVECTDGTTDSDGSVEVTIQAGVTTTCTFTNTYTAPMTEKIFAVAYSDKDTTDGGYNPTEDVLIAKLVDGNDNGYLDSGDKVITFKYPIAHTISDWTTDFRSFGVTEHTITGADAVAGSFVEVWYDKIFYDTNGNPYETWRVSFSWQEMAQYERYTEGQSMSNSGLTDGYTFPYTDVIDVTPGSPSVPETATALYGDDFNTGQNSFLDVDLYDTGTS